MFPNPVRSKIIRVGLLFTLIACLMSFFAYRAYVLLGYPLTGIDDANIYMVYGWNLIHGHGFVYNVGGERVEGFSSLLYVILISPFFLTQNPEKTLLLANIGMLSASLTFLLWVACSAARKSIANLHPATMVATGILFVGWTFSSPAFITWTTLTLMDTGLWCSILMFATGISILSFHNDSDASHNLAAWIITLIMLARPEGLAWGLVFVGFQAIATYNKKREIRGTIRLTLKPLTIYLVIAVSLFVFRLMYFGFPLPNTYYAKVSPSLSYNLQEGTKYLVSFLSSNFVLTAMTGICLIFPFFIIWKTIRTTIRSLSRLDAVGLMASLTVLCGLLLPVLTGGDHFTWFRFYQPIWPLVPLPCLCLLLSCTNPEKAISKRKTITHIILTACLMAILILSSNPSWHATSFRKMDYEFMLAQCGRRTGMVMNEIFTQEEKPSVGVIVAGGIAYTYEGKVVDLMGLNHIEMGHSRGDRKGPKNHAAFSKDIFWELTPDMLLPRFCNEIPSPSFFSGSDLNMALKDLLKEEHFNQAYQLAYIPVQEDSRHGFLVAYFLKSCLPDIHPGPIPLN